MTRIEPDLERTVRGWLQDGVSALPDHVFDAVVAQAPRIRQRRIAWWPPDPTRARLLAALAAVIVLAVTVVGFLLGTNVGDDDSDATWRLFPVVEEAPLEPGRYLIDDPFPVRIGLTVPGGWTALPTRATLAQLGRDAGGAGLSFTFVEAIYADPCHDEAGLVDPPVGPTADDLAAALASLPGVIVSGPSDTMIDGVPALTLTLTAPAVFEGCTAAQEPLFKIWGVPEGHWLDPGERNRLWIVSVGDTRLVISAEEFDNSSPQALAELNGIVASIELDPLVESFVDTGSEGPAPSYMPLPGAGPIAPGDYITAIQLHRYAGSMSIPLDGLHRLLFSIADPGWSSTGTGIQRPGGADASVGYEAWSIGRIYSDPCHWQADEPGLVDPAELETLAGLTNALSRGWIAEPSGSGVDPPRDAPLATEPIDLPRFGRFGQFVELTVPPEIDLNTCDGIEYRLWEDSSGRPRSAREAGEQIRLYLVDADPGLFVVDAWTLATASQRDREAQNLLFNGMWLFDPEPGAEE